MKMQIGRWGNSLAVRLPRDFVERFQLEEGGELDTLGLEKQLEVEREERRQQRRAEALEAIRNTRLTLPEDWKLEREEMNWRPALDRW